MIDFLTELSEFIWDVNNAIVGGVFFYGLVRFLVWAYKEVKKDV